LIIQALRLPLFVPYRVRNLVFDGLSSWRFFWGLATTWTVLDGLLFLFVLNMMQQDNLKLAQTGFRYDSVTIIALGALWLLGLAGIASRTRLRQARQQEREEADREIRNLARFADESPNPLLRLSRNGQLLYVNTAGEPLREILNAPGQRALQAHWRALVNDCFRQGRPVESEEAIVGRLYLCVFVPVRDENYANVYTRDITLRKAAEDRLRQLSRAVEQSPASVMITDTSGRIEYVNPKFCQVTGYSAEEAVGKNPKVLKSGDMAPETYETMWQTIASGRTWSGEFHNRKKNGELYWELTSINPVRDATGKVTHYVSINEDITERKLAEAEREKLIGELKKALAEVKTLSGLLPICAGCKKIRNDQGYWSQIENYISLHTDARFSHSFCPDCMKVYFPEVDFEKARKEMEQERNQ
jgi:PAS domain S-box-containing protein